jgi:hypothetical protein
VGLKITVENPNYARDEEFEVRGIPGLFKSGQARTLTEDEEAEAVSFYGMSLKDRFKDVKWIKVEGAAETKVSDVVPEGGE